jgi:hypothetical protein
LWRPLKSCAATLACSVYRIIIT